MKIIFFFALISFCLFVGACNFEYTEIQDIEITHFADDERNAQLAEDLMHYDPRFLAHQIPAYTMETSKGLRLGYFVRSSDGKPSYRITYNRSVDAVAENLDDLKSQFEAYIPVLAANHASKESVFRELEPLGLSWVRNFFSTDANVLLENSSQLLRDYVTVKQLEKIQSEFAANFGSPTDFEFVRAQFYEEHVDIPESVSLFYETHVTDGSVFIFRVSLCEVDSEWLAIGFRFDKLR